MHRGNISRLLAGTELKLGEKAKKRKMFPSAPQNQDSPTRETGSTG
ncbi:hypothetical protein ACFLVS_04400 [Chloroflexota bacterium]